MMENKIKSINTQHIIDEMMGDFFFHQDPHLLKQEYRAFFDPSEVNQNMLKKYMVLFSNVRYAWQKTLRYKNYFENFYPPADKINEIEALNHHIHAYLEDMITLKNKIEVLFGKMKNDIKKVAVNKTDIDAFFKAGVEKTKKVFSGVSKHRDRHRHRGMRFFDNDLLKAENAQGSLQMLSIPVFDATLNKEYKPEIIAKFMKEKEESFVIAKKRWIEMARKNDAHTTGYLDAIFDGIRPSLYQFLNITPIHAIITTAENQQHAS